MLDGIVEDSFVWRRGERCGVLGAILPSLSLKKPLVLGPRFQRGPFFTGQRLRFINDLIGEIEVAWGLIIL